MYSVAGWMYRRNPDGLFDVPVQSGGIFQSIDDDNAGLIPNTEAQKGTSSLGLLALTYGNSSDSDEEEFEADTRTKACQTKAMDCSPESGLHCHDARTSNKVSCTDVVHLQISGSSDKQGSTKSISESRKLQSLDGTVGYKTCSFASMELDNLTDRSRHQGKEQNASYCSPMAHKAETTTATSLVDFENKPFTTRPDEDSSRMHIFCLQHAVQVEKQLRSIGGANIMLVCHPGDYLFGS